ncbi:WG repeat-containing protein [Flavobacteriaceae bacterium TK19130]|nr:WG repeat-containing protein [Thermobacterium salinum]
MKFIILIIFSLLILGCANQKLVAPVKFEGKYGFIEKDGNWHLEPKFDSIRNFTNGFADSYKNGKVGVINAKGELVIEHKFDFIGNIYDNRFLVLLNDKYNFVDLKGELISSEFYYDAEDFSNGLAPVKHSENGKWSYINKNGILQTDTIYDYVNDFDKKHAKVEIAKNHFIINRKGQIIDTINIDYQKNTRKLRLIGDSDSGTLGRINRNGDTIMKGVYTSFGYVQSDKFWYNKRGKYGLADTTGTILIEPIYDYLTYFSDNGLAITKKGDKFGYINANGVIIIDFLFDDARGFRNGYAGVKLNGKWGFIDKKGRFIIEPKFDKIEDEFKTINSYSERMYEFDYE